MSIIKRNENVTWEEFHNLDRQIFDDYIIKKEAFPDLKQKGLFFLYIESSKNPIGYIYLKVFGKEGQVSRHGVLPEYRQQGYGKELLSYGLDWLKKQGCTQAFVYILEDYVPGLILYSSYGFEKCKAVYQFKIDYKTLDAIDIDTDSYTIKKLARTEINPFIEKYDLVKEKVESYYNTEEENIIIGFYYEDTIRGFGRFTPTYPGIFPLFISYANSIYAFLELTRQKWALQKYDYMLITFEDQVSIYKELEKNFTEIRKLSLQKKQLSKT